MSLKSKRHKYNFIKAEWISGYFEEDDKKFTPFVNEFTADEYENIINLKYIFKTKNYNFSKKFWKDVINNMQPSQLVEPATAFWGMEGRPGRTVGDDVENYIPWFIRNVKCIPVYTKECQISTSVLLNSENIKTVSGPYLPVFDGLELSPDWKSFFRFRTELKLSDYLVLLTEISSDIDDNGKIKAGNFARIQSVYSTLLSDCTNWSTDDISKVEEWVGTGKLLNTKRHFTECNSLKFFLDGNNRIFQEQFHFININAENKQHPNLEVFLGHFGIKILRQNDFELVHSQSELCLILKKHLMEIIPYFQLWINNEVDDASANEHIEKLEATAQALNINQADDLRIRYADIGFDKGINVHHDKTTLFVTKPWLTNNVLLRLSEVLCRYFKLPGHDRKLDFLLRSNENEIQDFLEQENIEIPQDLLEKKNKDSEPAQESSPRTVTPLQCFSSFEEVEQAVNEGRIIPEEFFHTPDPNFDKLRYAEGLVSRAVLNIISYLETLPEYNCTNYYEIAKSIIGGISKNGNDLTIVARPSDNEEVLLYYTSEFDVLEYVDAEFWCEDGINPPKQITLGQLFKKTGINRIPVKNINFSETEVEGLLNTPKSDEFDFNPVPFVPQKIARIVSSFANSEGGTLVFGLNEINPNTNEIVGLSADFKVVEITKNAISMLSSIPDITYDLITYESQSIFVIKTEKSDDIVLLDGEKYVREEAKTIIQEESSAQRVPLRISRFTKTFAIIIGIEEYHPNNQITSVKYANNDVTIFKEMLINNMNIDENDIYLFQNEDALRSLLEYNLHGLFHELTEDARLIFYYVGHGFHDGVTNYLTTYDTHKHHIADTGVSLRKILLDPLRKSKCKTALIFIDACAQSFQNSNERSHISNINDEEFIALTHDFPYYATFLSCHPEQKSYSSDVLSNGIWTHHLVKALRGSVSEVIKGDKYITDILLKEYLSECVNEYTKDELQKEQNPKAIIDSGSENVIIELIEPDDSPSI